MPVVLRVLGFRIWILNPPREHPPAHVHVEKAGAEVVILLDPIRIREVVGMKNADIVTAVRIVEDHRHYLVTQWGKHHG